MAGLWSAVSGCPSWSRGPSGADLALLGVRAELHTHTVCVRDAPEWIEERSSSFFVFMKELEIGKSETSSGS